MNPTLNPIEARMEYSELMYEIQNDPTIINKELELSVLETMILERKKYDSVKYSKDKLQDTLNETYSKYYNDEKLKCSSELEKIIYSFHELKENLKKTETLYDEHAPAFIFVLNYDSSKSKHHQHISENDKPYTKNIYQDFNDSKKLLHKIAYQDGAVLIDKNGIINSTNVLLTNLNPDEVILRDTNEMIKNNNPYFSEIVPDWKLLGFLDENVNARHKNSLTASYHMEGTVIYTLSEQTGHIRRMENGYITHSTLKEESRKNSEFYTFNSKLNLEREYAKNSIELRV